MHPVTKHITLYSKSICANMVAVGGANNMHSVNRGGGGGAQTDLSIDSTQNSGRYVPVLRKLTYNPCLEKNLLDYPKIRLPKIELH